MNYPVYISCYSHIQQPEKKLSTIVYELPGAKGSVNITQCERLASIFCYNKGNNSFRTVLVMNMNIYV